jgi:fermentation-respiration switch protein FrsA (DUF1100 family)
VRQKVTVATLVVLLAASACAGDDPAGDGTTTTVATTTTRPETYPVGRRTIELVDTTRPTAADPGREGAELPERTLPVTLLYPAAEGGQAATPDAAPADGAFPLVVFSHGVGSTPSFYEPGLRELASAGYVVAAPTFPLTSGPGAGLTDYVNQPGDVSFVIDELLDLPADDPLAGRVDEDSIAAAGHSLGGITTIGVGLNSCCADPRLDAIVEISGMRLPFPDGEFDDLGSVPFLAIHGAKDARVPVAGSDSLFAEAPGPAAYLRFPEAGHAEFLAEHLTLVSEVIRAFLDRYLYDEADALDDVPLLVEADGSATFELKSA